MGSSGYNKEKREKREKRNIKNTAKNNVNKNEISFKNPICDDDFETLWESIPKDQYLCPYCGSVPELVNIFTDNGCIEFKCKCKGEMAFKVRDYIKELSESKYTYFNAKCYECNRFQKDLRKEGQMLQYCYLCKKDYCSDCMNNPEHPKNHLDNCIPVCEKTSRCLFHFDGSEYTSFCRQCNINICSKYSNKEHVHEDHDKINFFEIEVKKNKIIEKNKTLYEMIKFNKLILRTYENFPNNFFHVINAVNLIKSIELENSRKAKELDELFTKLETKIHSQNKVIKDLNKKLNLSLTGKEEDLDLRKTNFTDEYLQQLALIPFMNLINLDLSHNKITNITYLKDINTSNLKSLLLNNNLIDDIGVFESMNLSNLIELGLKNNKIKNVSSLLKSDLSSLNLLRLEGNEIDKTKNDVKKLIKKFTKQIILTPKTLKEFNEKYNSNISEEINVINFRDKKTGSEVLRDLYLASKNYDEVKELDLANCEIDDITYLAYISFKSLKILDLSVNKIENIEPLMNAKFINLKNIYLNDNKIKNITPLKSMKFEALTLISIKDNEIDLNNKQSQDIINELRNRDIEVE